MSRTKRHLEELWEDGQVPGFQEMNLKNFKHNGSEYSAECEQCDKVFVQETPIPEGVICPTCYAEDQHKLQNYHR